MAEFSRLPGLRKERPESGRQRRPEFRRQGTREERAAHAAWRLQRVPLDHPGVYRCIMCVKKLLKVVV